jgi:hypothetical protein
MSTKWQLKTDGVNFWIEDDFYTICNVSNKDTVEETKANGLVLAKAPEMLEMLKSCYERLYLLGVEKGDINSEPLIRMTAQLIKEATTI